MPAHACSVHLAQVTPTSPTVPFDMTFWIDVDGEVFAPSESLVSSPGVPVTAASWTGNLVREDVAGAVDMRPMTVTVHVHGDGQDSVEQTTLPFASGTSVTVSTGHFDLRFDIGPLTTSPSPPAPRSIHVAPDLSAPVALVPQRVYAEVCPVIPVFADRASHRPTWVRSASSFRREGPAALGPGQDVNTIPNPIVIPRVAQATTETAARLLVTFHSPASLDPGRFRWEIDPASAGAATFVTSNVGRMTTLAGTRDGEILVNLLFDGVRLSVHRAVVAPIVRIPLRMNILEEEHDRVPAVDRSLLVASIPIANQLLRQIGVELFGDPAGTTSTPSSLTTNIVSNRYVAPGLYAVVVRRHADMFNLTSLQRSLAPTVLAATTPAARAAALAPLTDRAQALASINAADDVITVTYLDAIYYQPHPPGRPDLVDAQAEILSSSSLTTIHDPGSPSSSWLEPSGIPGDLPTIAHSPDMRLLWGHPTSIQPGINFTSRALRHDPRFVGHVLAHEVAHALGLAHRGADAEADGVPGPILENLMIVDVADHTSRAMNLDMLQYLAIAASDVYVHRRPP